MAINYLNCTPHDINIYSKEDTVFDPDVRKLIIKDGAQPIRVIPASGKLLNCQKETGSLPHWVADNYPDPFLVGAIEFTGADYCPNEPNTLYIVSALYRAAIVQLTEGILPRLAVVVDMVYSDSKDPKPIGCLGLAVG